MNIHPLWTICLITRVSILLLAGFLINNKHEYTRLFSIITLFLIGLAFLYKNLTGSNNEIQINKVFWHETRLVHSILYILSSYYLYRKNSVMTIICLGIDIIFSIIYRIVTNQ